MKRILIIVAAVLAVLAIAAAVILPKVLDPERYRPRIEQMIEQCLRPARVHATQAPGHATVLARELAGDGFDTIIAAEHTQLADALRGSRTAPRSDRQQRCCGERRQIPTEDSV